MADRRRFAMTLIETLVVIGILGVLVALTVPAIQRVREAGNRARCANNLRQIGLALHGYHDIHHALPMGHTPPGKPETLPFAGWMLRILPHIEQGPLWEQALNSYAQNPGRFPWDFPPHPGFSTVVSTYACPSVPRKFTFGMWSSNVSAACSSYLGVLGRNHWKLDGCLFSGSAVRLTDVTDGTSNTLLVGERPPSDDRIFGWWYAGAGQELNGSADQVLGVREFNAGLFRPGCPPGPYHYQAGRIDDPCAVFHFWSLHPGGAHFLMADGSAHFLSYSAEPLMAALSTRAAGEPTALPE